MLYVNEKHQVNVSFAGGRGILNERIWIEYLSNKKNEILDVLLAGKWEKYKAKIAEY